MNAKKLEAPKILKQVSDLSRNMSKEPPRSLKTNVKNAINIKRTSLSRSTSLKDTHFNIKALVGHNNTNSGSNLNAIAENGNENEIFLGNDSQSTLSNHTSIDEINDEYSNKYDSSGGGGGGGGIGVGNSGYKSEMNYNEGKAYRMMNIKFSDTYKGNN